MSNTAEAIEPTVALQPIHNQRDFGLAKHRFNYHDANYPRKLTPQQLTDSALWTAVAQNHLRPGDEVRVIAEDNSFYARLLVLAKSANIARMFVLEYIEMDTVVRINNDVMDGATDSDPFHIKLRGPRKWCIVNRQTQQVIKEDIATQHEALRDLAEYRQALGK